MVLKVRRTLESRTDEDSANRDFKIFIFVLLNFAALLSVRYDSFSDVGEIRVYRRADFQSGSRVLKKVF